MKRRTSLDSSRGIGGLAVRFVNRFVNLIEFDGLRGGWEIVQGPSGN